MSKILRRVDSKELIMKQKSVLLVLSVFVSSLFISCGEKSKEEKFLSDFEELIEKAEEVKTKDDLESFMTLAEQFEKKIADLYGVNDPENIEKSNLNFTDEQKERYYKLMERMISAGKKTQEINSSKDSSDEESSNSADEKDSDDEMVENDSDAPDVDEMLDSYEEYVDEYISYIKKASNGDMSALEEYPKLMETANELSEKIGKCQGDMTSSQLSRYNKISMKMLEAAKQMQ